MSNFIEFSKLVWPNRINVKKLLQLNSYFLIRAKRNTFKKQQMQIQSTRQLLKN